MKTINKYRSWFTLLAVLMVISGIVMITFSFRQKVTLIIDGKTQEVVSFALRPTAVLRAAGIEVRPEDKLSPPLKAFWFSSNTIYLQRAQPIQIVAGENTTSLVSAERISANLLLEAGYPLFPGDQVLWNAAVIDQNALLPSGRAYLLQLRQAQPVTIVTDDGSITFYSSQASLGMALLEAGVQITPEDTLSLDLETPLDRALTVSLRRAKLLTVSVNGHTVTGLSSALTVGQALSDLGLALQDLDYSEPSEESALPEDGIIRIVRIKEALVLQKEEVPYQSSYQPDPETELDQFSVVQPGQIGLIVNRIRIRYANGEEIGRVEDENWQASKSQDGIIGYGTKVVIRTEVINGQTIEYWRKISVYATSYAPFSQGGIYTGTTSTASGIPLEKGIVAVLVSWYRAMKFQKVYIPGYGYGTIADTGGGIPGRPWVDLGFSDDDYESWHFWVPMYFLTPVPSYIPYLLP